MAKKIVFDIEVDGFDEVDASIDKVIDSTKSLKQQLKELEVLTQTATDPETFQRYAQAAGEIKDRIGDAKSAINNFSSDTKKLDTTIGAVQGLAGAFATVQGSIALLTGDNEKLDKVIKNVQGSLAVLNGVQQVAKSLNKESAEGAALYAAANKILSFSLKDVVKGLGVFKTALIATGIGALVVAVGLLVANFDALKESLFGIGAQDKLNLETQEKSAALSQQQLEDISAQENILKLSGKSEKEILEMKVKASQLAIQTQETVINTLEVQTKAQVEATKRNKEFTKSILDFIALPFETILSGIDEIGKAVGLNFGLLEGFKSGVDSVAGFLFDPEETQNKGDEQIKEAKKVLEKQKNDLAGFQLGIQAINQKGAEEARKKREENAKKQQDIDKVNEANRLAAIQDDQLRETQILESSQNDRLKVAQANGYDIQALQQVFAKEESDLIQKHKDEKKKKEEEDSKAALEVKKTAYEAELQALSDKYAKEAILNANGKLTPEQLQAQADEEKVILDKKLKDLLITQEGYDLILAENKSKVDEANKKVSEDEKKREKDKQDAIFQGAQNTLQGLSDLTTLFAGKSLEAQKKAFEINKKIQIAQTLISTYASAQAAFESQAAIPVVGPVLGGIAAAAAIAGGLLKIKQIQETKFNSGSSPSSSTGAGSATGTGNTERSVNPFTNQQLSGPIQQTGAFSQGKNQRVYVVESDITNTQNKVKIIQDNANGKW